MGFREEGVSGSRSGRRVVQGKGVRLRVVRGKALLEELIERGWH